VARLRNVTITLDEDVARWARIRAAERDTSLSRLVGELLREKMLDEQGYDAAMREYLARPARTLRKPKARYPRRADPHDR
jgi:plasmid stability protein